MAALLAAVLAAAGAVVADELPAYASTCTTSAATGSCGPYDYPQITSSDGTRTYVNNNVWSPIPGWSETLTATDPGNWSVVANMPAGNTAMVSYPDVQELYNNVPLSSYSSLISAFTETMNPQSGTVGEAAYDLWLNNWNDEVMIWNDNHGQDLSYDTDLGPVTIGGQKFEVYRNGDPGPGEELIVSLDGNEQSGTIDILTTLKWLEGKGYLPFGTTLTSIDYGWEIASTGGKPETYQISSFCIDENGATKCGTGGLSSPSPTSSPLSAPPTRAPTSSPASQAPTFTPPTQAPSSSGPTQAATSPSPSSQTPLWYWMVTRASTGTDVFLPAPLQRRDGPGQHPRGHHRAELFVGFPS
jgi:hypothetical protein